MAWRRVPTTLRSRDWLNNHREGTDSRRRGLFLIFYLHRMGCTSEASSDCTRQIGQTTTGKGLSTGGGDVDDCATEGPCIGGNFQPWDCTGLVKRPQGRASWPQEEVFLYFLDFVWEQLGGRGGHREGRLGGDFRPWRRGIVLKRSRNLPEGCGNHRKGGGTEGV